MSTVKISQLPLISQINSNTANTLFVGVDVPTLTTGKMTVTTLAAGLYSNNALVVGLNPIQLSNTIAQFSGSDVQFTQVNLQNFNANGSGDYIVTADNGTNSNSYIDLGLNNSQFNGGTQYSSMNPYDGYLYVHGPSDSSISGNLIIGTASSGANILFIVGNTQSQNIVATLTKTGIVLNTQSYLTFSDGTIQSTAGASNVYTQAAYNLANTVASNLSANNTLQANINSTQNSWISSNSTYSISAYNFANTVNTYANSAYAFSNTVNTYAFSAYAYSNTINTYAYSAYSFANTVNAYAYSAYAFANSINAFASSINTVQSGINSTQNTWISSNATFIQSAYNQANLANSIASTALQNTTGILAGSLTITGDVSANNYHANTLIFQYGSALIETLSQVGGPIKDINITAGSDLGQNNGGTITITAGQTLALGKSGGNINLIANGNNSVVNVTSNTINFSGNIIASGVQSTVGPITTGNLIINGTTTSNGNATFNGTSVTFAGTVQPQKGFIYTPTVYPGAQTAITIDMSNNSVVRAQTSSGLTVTLSNLLAGKEVVAWITNTSGLSQTFTHGLSSTNSTTNATTYSIPGTSTILVRYMSIDGTTQNTFVAVTHA